MTSFTLTNVALDAARDNFNGLVGATSLAVTWFAIGTGTQGSPATATQLANEVLRMPLTSITNGASHGESLLQALLSPTSGVGFAITEIAFFGGAASSATNSGSMFLYGLFSHTHSGTESIQFTGDNTF